MGSGLYKNISDIAIEINSHGYGQVQKVQK